VGQFLLPTWNGVGNVVWVQNARSEVMCIFQDSDKDMFDQFVGILRVAAIISFVLIGIFGLKKVVMFFLP
jgi:hypothetical protein